MADIKGILDALMTTWPVKTGEGILSALMSPGNAYRSTPDNPVTTSQMIEPASGLAGLMMFGATGAPAMSNAAGMGIRAYHGSPHSFDRFDLGKIGTGEGGQMYGHGLYFAENPAVADSYRVAGWQAPPLSNRIGGSENLQFPKGHGYEVNINAKPEQFLNLDVPIGSQPQNVLDALYKMPLEGAYLRDVPHVSAAAITPTDAAAAARFNEAGIPGIRYLDQGSRGVGAGTSNYVVFSPDIVEILRKYGLVGTLGGAAIGAGSEDR